MTTTKNTIKEIFLNIQPTATVTEKKLANGDVIVYVNGQTAYNKEDRYNAANWITMMTNAFNRSK